MDLDAALAQSSFVDLAKIVAERTSPLVSWIGAGLSASAGIPGWKALRGQVHQAAVVKANTLNANDIARALSTLSSIVGVVDPWIAFERLHEVIGATSFVSEIRHALDTSGKQLPEAYKLLLKLPLRGILNLNIDVFCSNAVRTIEQPRWRIFTGQNASRMTHILQNVRQPFAVQLHGTYDDQTSWVFRRKELRKLLKDSGYVNFIRALLSTHTLMFVGVSVDDVAAGGFLEDLVKVGVSAGTHYWLTDRSDAASDRWAEKIGIRIIRYSAEHGHRMLLEVLTRLASYVSLDDVLVPPISSGAASATSAPPSQDELITRPVDEIRSVLNSVISALPANEPEQLIALRRAYRKCLPIAWIVEAEAPYDSFFGRRIESKIGEGAFGSVYLAKDPAGDLTAIKVLHQDVYSDLDMLNSFRRGVRSMRFLTSDSLPGVVKSIEAFEMPPSVVMEYVPGLTLLEAVNKLYISDWRTRLEIATRLAVIIRAAHQSPQHVLHRDLRPHNIMLKNYFVSGDEIDLVVLDFDLSWHRDSLERSIYPRVEGALGYAAPEQFTSGVGARTRSALVDSFGLGMTMFFLGAGRHPQPHEQNSSRWTSVLKQEIAMQLYPEWQSLPVRFAKLIHDLTQSEQERRVDFALADLELRRMHGTLNRTSISASVVAEEVMYRVISGADYTWDNDSDLALSHLSGGAFSCRGDEAADIVTASFEWMDTGDRDRRQLAAQLRSIAEFAERRLSPGWTRKAHSVTPTSLKLEYERDATGLCEKLGHAVELLQQIKAKFAF